MEDFTIVTVYEPEHTDWRVIYDLDNLIVWINTASTDGAVRIEGGE